MADVVDLFALQPTFSDGLARAAIDRNGNARLTFYVEHTDEETGGCSKIVAAKLIVPQNALPAMAAMLVGSMSPEGRKCAEAWHSGVLAHA